MGTFLVILAFILLLAGLVGSIVPAIPGPPLGFLGLLILHWQGYGDFSNVFLWIFAGVVVAIMVIDNFLPAWMTKSFGGSRMAVTGSVIGLIVGMIFFAPIGLLVGPFLGALAGELINIRIQESRNKKNNKNESDTSIEEKSKYRKALKAAFGAFLAFILGTGAKLIIGSVMIYFAFSAVF